MTKEFFTRRQCIHRFASTTTKRSSNGSNTIRPIYKSLRQTPFLQAFRSKTTASPRHNASLSLPPHTTTQTPLGALSETIASRSGTSKATPRTSFFPETSSKSVAYWLLFSSASVFGIVVFGGLTRLTESGLSITEWRPVTGSLPPTTQEKWESEFALYRASPEFQQLNSHMTLEEFKAIYYMEWTHRLWGRVIGLTTLFPTIFFIATRRMSKSMALASTGICCMIAFQGFIGWWMVKSGLKDDLFAPGSTPRVSQYRLTAHLGTAFLVYSAMLLSGLTILRSHAALADPTKALKTLETLRSPALLPFRRLVTALTLLVFTTAMSGALVAGLDAGLIYNEFPWMGLGLTPPSKELWDPFYSRSEDGGDLWWRNMTANPSLVQLDHRILATTTFTAIIALWGYSRFNPRVRAMLPKPAATAMMGVVHMALLQVTLGISTLLLMVPTWLAAAHQAGSLMLLTTALVLGHRVAVPKNLLSMVQQRTKVVNVGGFRNMVVRKGGQTPAKKI